MEHVNKLFKLALKQLDVNVNEKGNVLLNLSKHLNAFKWM